MKSKKNEELNFLYLDNKKKNKKTSKKTKKREKDKINTQNENDVFNFDNEIVIGVTPIEDEEEKKDNPLKNNKKKKAPKKKKGAGKKSAPKKTKNNKKKQKKEKKIRKENILLKKIIKWIILIVATVVAFIFFMMSPLFNVVEINVIGNEIIDYNTIIDLSEIKIGDNIYKTSKKNIKQNIKQNAYIESVEVKRNIPNKIDIIIKERKATYMLEYENNYAYINNQGYILEISSQSLDTPIISGYTTEKEEIEVGTRLNKEDLTRLENVLKITESAEVNGVNCKINRINISDKQNYTLYIDEEGKTIYLGDASNLSTRMLYIKAILDDTKGIEGEIFVNGDLVNEKAFFRPKE